MQKLSFRVETQSPQSGSRNTDLRLPRFLPHLLNAQHSQEPRGRYRNRTPNKRRKSAQAKIAAAAAENWHWTNPSNIVYNRYRQGGQSIISLRATAESPHIPAGSSIQPQTNLPLNLCAQHSLTPRNAASLCFRHRLLWCAVQRAGWRSQFCGAALRPIAKCRQPTQTAREVIA